MGAISLTQAKTQLAMWIEAEKQVALGQSYQIGSRRIQRADLKEVRAQIKFWESKVNDLETVAKRGGRRKVMRVIPRDL